MSNSNSVSNFDRRASATLSESSFLNNSRKLIENDDADDELFIPELGSGEDHAMPGLGSLQCLTKMDSLDEESASAKPLKPLNLGSVPDLGIGRLGSLGTPPGSTIPNRLGEYFDTVEFIYDKKRNNLKDI